MLRRLALLKRVSVLAVSAALSLSVSCGSDGGICNNACDQVQSLCSFSDGQAESCVEECRERGRAQPDTTRADIRCVAERTATCNDVLRCNFRTQYPEPGGSSGSSSSGGLCSNSCEFAADSECDDGGPGADFNVCPLGTDCADCGPRSGSSGGSLCSNSCEFAGDSECDDGGPGADFNECPLGTDCADCGPRSGSSGCSNTCQFAGDSECDDGGPGADFNECPLGTDCADCGPR